MKICPVGTELFYADGQTHDKVTIAFRSFENAPNESEYTTPLRQSVGIIRFQLTVPVGVQAA